MLSSRPPDDDAAVFVPVRFAAQVLGRPQATIRTWVREETVRARRDGDQLQVHVLDAAAASRDRGRRRRLLPDPGASA